MLTIDIGDGRTAPMTPDPAVFGHAFAEVVATAVAWDDRRRAEVNEVYDAAYDLDGYAEAAVRVEDLVQMSALGDWSCQFGEPGEQPEAGPYIDTLTRHVSEGAGYVAQAVLARDLGFITEATFTAVTAWWVAAGLPSPEPRPGFTFAGSEDEASTLARRFHYSREDAGWPLSVLAEATS